MTSAAKPIGSDALTAVGGFPGLRILSAIEDGSNIVKRDIGVLIEAMEAPLPKEYTGPRFRQLVRA